MKPIGDISKINIKPGDTVLFKRGSFIRDRLHNVCGENGKPITYGAYGEGEKPTDGGGLQIKNNVFYNAPYGAAIYSIISQDAEKQVDLEKNTYYTENRDLLNRWSGENYKTFEEYKCCEQGCRYEKMDITNILTKWSKQRL